MNRVAGRMAGLVHFSVFECVSWVIEVEVASWAVIWMIDGAKKCSKVIEMSRFLH